jgi:Putative lumazine-binding
MHRSSLLRALALALALLVLLALPFTVAPVGAQAAPRPATAEVMAVVTRLFDGMRAGDSAMVRSVFHPQVRLLTVAKGRDGAQRLVVENSIDEFAKAVGTPHPQPWDERLWNERVEIDGALASVWVDYSFFLGSTFSHCGIDHFLLVRGDDGVWRIISLADTRRTEGCKTS